MNAIDSEILVGVAQRITARIGISETFTPCILRSLFNADQADADQAEAALRLIWKSGHTVIGTTLAARRLKHAA